MRVAVLFLVLSSLVQAIPVPSELTAALAGFRTEGPKGWSFTQTTVGGDRRMTEAYDAAKPESERWTLLEKDGQPPTPEEIDAYRHQQARRIGNQTAPNVKDQLDLDSCTLVSDDGERAVYRFLLKPGNADDHSAAHMASTFTLHRPTGTIERVELASFEPFSPVFLVKVAEARTVITYSLPADGRPSLLQSVAMRVRGRAMWFRSLDSDLAVTYSDYVYAGRQ